jgi:hypothetical protein
MWRHVALVGADVSEERIAITGNIVPVLLIPSILMMEALYPSETSVLTKATLRHILKISLFKSVVMKARMQTLHSKSY